MALSEKGLFVPNMERFLNASGKSCETNRNEVLIKDSGAEGKIVASFMQQCVFLEDRVRNVELNATPSRHASARDFCEWVRVFY